jgi:hypothetical protein
MAISILFVCGHTLQATGDEVGPRCACGESRIESVKAPAPKFRGLALGPCAQYEDLPAKAVVLKKESDHAS